MQLVNAILALFRRKGEDMKVRITKHAPTSEIVTNQINYMGSNNPIMVLLDDFWFILNRTYQERFYMITPDGYAHEESRVEGEYHTNSDTVAMRLRALIQQVSADYGKYVPDTAALYTLWCDAHGRVSQFTYRYDNDRKEWRHVPV